MKPGDVISRYRITGRIGQGGMGVVYAAEDLRLLRPVALKFLPPEALDEKRKSRLLNEARAAALARHPNICPIHDIEEADGQLFIVMALIDGETLARRVARGRLQPEEAASIGAQIAAGLASAHDLGIVHRDIKSANIMVDSNGHVSIMDFGLALAPEALRLTGDGTSVGTPDYMSPEQAEGKDVDARTDIWSLGVVLFEMLTGRLPFRREHRGALAYAILNEPVPEMPGVPDELQRIVMRALAKDPTGRWPSANAMRRALEGGRSVSTFSAEDEPTHTLIVKVPRRRRATRFAAGVVALLLAATGGFAVYRLRAPGPAPGSAAPAAKQIAMMPFAAEGAPAAEGLDEVLTMALAAQPSVTVVPSSDLRRRGIQSVAAARKFYNVNYALASSAKTSAEQIEFTIKLVDAVRNLDIATRTLIYDPKNPIVSRDQVVGQVFRMLDLRPAAGNAPDPAAADAYSSYLEGRGLLARYDIPENVDKAIDRLSKAVAQDRKFALAYAGLGEAYWRKARATADKQWSTLAAQNAEYATQLDANIAGAHSVLGAIYRDAGRQDEAIRELKRAIELAPSNAEAPRQLAELYKSLGRFGEAEDLYRRAIQTRPTDWYGHLLLGMFCYERERYPEAEKALKEAAALAPDNDMVRLDLGAVYRMHGRYKDAIAEYQQALRIRTNAATYAALGGAYFYEHRFQDAVTAVEAAIDLDSMDYRYWGNLGIYCRWAPGNEAKSAPALRRALELAAKVADTRRTDYTAYANMAEYHARLGERNAALADIAQIPATSRGPFAARLAIVYDLAGRRADAIEVIRSNLKSPASLNQIKDNPDLAAVWKEGKFE